jgi:hypothetical protein
MVNVAPLLSYCISASSVTQIFWIMSTNSVQIDMSQQCLETQNSHTFNLLIKKKSL